MDFALSKVWDISSALSSLLMEVLQSRNGAVALYQRVKINKYITLIYFSFTLDFLAEETLNIYFSINLKACCLIKFLISTWYVWVSFFGLILNMKFTSHIVNLGVYTKISARCWTLEWVSFCLLLVTTQRCLSKDRSLPRGEFCPGVTLACDMDLDVNFSLFCDVKIFTNSTYNIFSYVFSEAVVCRYFHNRCSQRFRNIHKKALVLDSPFSKVVGLKAYRIIKKRRQRLCNFILASNLFYVSCLSCCLPKILCL